MEEITFHVQVTPSSDPDFPPLMFNAKVVVGEKLTDDFIDEIMSDFTEKIKKVKHILNKD